MGLERIYCFSLMACLKLLVRKEERLVEYPNFLLKILVGNLREGVGN